jgi:hypothetical protein
MRARDSRRDRFAAFAMQAIISERPTLTLLADGQQELDAEFQRVASGAKAYADALILELDREQNENQGD